jgi:hypothetical protein
MTVILNSCTQNQLQSCNRDCVLGVILRMLCCCNTFHCFFLTTVKYGFMLSGNHILSSSLVPVTVLCVRENMAGSWVVSKAICLCA